MDSDGMGEWASITRPYLERRIISRHWYDASMIRTGWCYTYYRMPDVQSCDASLVLKSVFCSTHNHLVSLSVDDSETIDGHVLETLSTLFQLGYGANLLKLHIRSPSTSALLMKFLTTPCAAWHHLLILNIEPRIFNSCYGVMPWKLSKADHTSAAAAATTITTTTTTTGTLATATSTSTSIACSGASTSTTTCPVTSSSLEPCSLFPRLEPVSLSVVNTVVAPVYLSSPLFTCLPSPTLGLALISLIATPQVMCQHVTIHVITFFN